MGRLLNIWTLSIIIDHALGLECRDRLILNGNSPPIFPNCDEADNAGQEKRLEDYQPFPYALRNTALYFHLDEYDTQVYAQYELANNSTELKDLVFNGSENIELLELKINGLIMEPGNGICRTAENGLYIPAFLLSEFITHVDSTTSKNSAINSNKTLIVNDKLLVEFISQNVPSKNLELSGLYKSEDLLITQNEAAGFRRITYSIDRPDVMSVYNVIIEADKKQFPIMLTNGNLIDQYEKNGTHYKQFLDPIPKPSYLFALVAGPLESIEDNFTVGRDCMDALAEFRGVGNVTQIDSSDPLLFYCNNFPTDPSITPRQIKLFVWGRPGISDRLEWALKSLKLAMLWDEIRFGRYYDLNEYHVVSARDFNAGAMENKGLNIFNEALIQTSPNLTTDSQYVRIKGVIGHEYFHNWSGDRVTIRDWFQITLKEGFTNFRDQQFLIDSENSKSYSVARLDDAKTVEEIQFLEDQSPLSHPIRPSSYRSVENFYTLTVYEKGAEVIRMYQTILGPKRFRNATDYYFAANDGRPATCEDFFQAMQTFYDQDLQQFFLWYSTPGTPMIEINSTEYDEKNHTYKFQINQLTSPDLWIPLKLSLLYDTVGQNSENDTMVSPDYLFHVRKGQQNTFKITSVPSQPIVSINRGFSAPVKIKPFWEEDEMLYIAQHDTDSYVRWKAINTILNKVAAFRYYNDAPSKDLDEYAIKIYGVLLKQIHLNDYTKFPFIARMIGIPRYKGLQSMIKPLDPIRAHKAIQNLRVFIVENFRKNFETLYTDLRNIELTRTQPYNVQPYQIAIRALQNSILNILSADSDNPTYQQWAAAQLANSTTANDRAAALITIANFPPSELKDRMLNEFRLQAKDENLLIDRWLGAIGSSDAEDTVEKVRALMDSEYYKDNTTPNRLRALLASFARQSVQFHSLDGSGYALVAGEVKRWDKFNPKLAASLCNAFAAITELEIPYQIRAREILQNVAETDNLSSNVREILDKILTSLTADDDTSTGVDSSSEASHSQRESDL